MFKSVRITIAIDIEKKDLFLDTLIQYGISLNLSGGRHPKVINSFYKELGVIPCFYHAPSSEYWSDFIKRNSTDDPLTEHLLKNEFINTYLSQFSELEKVKEFFIEGSVLLLIFKGLIKHKDIINFSKETIDNINRLGLGVYYDHL